MDPLHDLFNLFGQDKPDAHAKFNTDEYRHAEDREAYEEYLEDEDQDNDFADSQYEAGDYDDADGQSWNNF